MQILNKVFIVLVFFVPKIGIGQTTIAAGSIYTEINGNTHQISIGEMALAQTYVSTNFVLTQGFLQPQIKLMSTPYRERSTGISIQVFPNPFNSILSIQLSSLNNQKIELILTDLSGRKIRTQSLDMKSVNPLLHLDLSDLASGAYLLSPILENRPLKSILIQKF